MVPISRTILTMLFLSVWHLGLAQSATYFDSRTGNLTCAWESVGLREAPGKKGKYLSRVHFGESVELLGEEAYIQEEKRTYVRVRSADGKVGWVHEYLFVEDGQAAVVLDDGRIYKRPNTPSTITTDYFEAGELVIMQTEVGGWTHLVSKQKTKNGWMRDPGKVSSAAEDVEIATLMYKINAEKDADKRKKQMTDLAAQARKSRSPLSMIIENQSPQNQTLTKERSLLANSTQTAVSGTPSVSRLPRQAAARTVQRPDHLSGNLRAFKQEIGPIYQMETVKRMRTDFYAAHPTLPLGTKVRVAIPDNMGFVELEIVARAPARQQAILGMPPACIEAIFGDTVPRKVEILY